MRRITVGRVSACLAIGVAAGLCTGCVSSYDGAVQMAREAAAYPLEYAVTTMEKVSESARIGQTIDRDDIENYNWGLLLDESDRADPDFRFVAVTSFSQDGESLEARIFIRNTATFSRGLSSTSAAVHGCAALTTSSDSSVSVHDEPCEEWVTEFAFEDSQEVSLAGLPETQE